MSIVDNVGGVVLLTAVWRSYLLTNSMSNVQLSASTCRKFKSTYFFGNHNPERTSNGSLYSFHQKVWGEELSQNTMK